jgi:hypothetical protein
MDEGQCPFVVGEVTIFTHRSGKAGRPGHHGLPEIGARRSLRPRPPASIFATAGASERHNGTSRHQDGIFHEPGMGALT